MKTQKLLFVFLAVMMIMTLVLSVGMTSALAAEDVSDETLTVCLPEEPADLLPLHSPRANPFVVPNLYDTLLTFNSKTGEVGPGVATSWEWVDETHLRLEMRDDVVAYDGTILTANDVLFSAKLGVESGSVYWKYVNLDECSVESEFVFVLGLKEPHSTIVDMLSVDKMLSLVDESSMEAAGGYEACVHNPLCGTGAYKFEEWKEGEYLTLVRNEDYWGEPGYFKTIKFTWIADSAARTMTLASGDADFACELSNANLMTVEGYDGCEIYKWTPGNVFVLFFNTANEYLSNPLVREAITYAIDRDALNAVASGGTCTLADSILAKSNPHYVPSQREYKVDLEKAKALLTEAGYPDGFELFMPCPNVHLQVVEVIQACLGQIGIKGNIEVVELPVYLGYTDVGNFGIGYQRTVPDDVTNVLSHFDDRLSSMERGGGIFGGDRAFDEIIDNVKFSTDEEASQEAWKVFQDYIREQNYFMPLFEEQCFNASRGSYDVQYNGLGFLVFKSVRPIV